MKKMLRLWAAALCLGATVFGPPAEAAQPQTEAQTANGTAQPQTEAQTANGAAQPQTEAQTANGAAQPQTEAAAAEPGAAQKTAKRIAIVPVLDSTGGWLTPQAYALLQDRMDHELHIPLNETMHWVDFIDEDEARDAFMAAIKAQGKKKKPELAAREAARALHADLVACLAVDEYYEHIIMGWHGITYIESAVHLTVYGYDAVHDRLIKAPGSRWERSEFHPVYKVEVLAEEALDEALRQASLRSVVFPLTKKDPAGA